MEYGQLCIGESTTVVPVYGEPMKRAQLLQVQKTPTQVRIKIKSTNAKAFNHSRG
jgi:hypothetical protein